MFQFGTITDQKTLGCLLLWINKAKTTVKTYMGCRCYGRLQPNTKEFTRLTYTELVLELEQKMRINKLKSSGLAKPY